MEKKILNVVCVTKKLSRKDCNASLWHLNIAGRAVLYEEKGLIIFLGERYSILSTRPGLDTTSLVYQTEALETRSEYGRWDLYTDIPWEGSGATPEAIRRNAEGTVKWTEENDTERNRQFL